MSSLESKAQELFVVEPEQNGSEFGGFNPASFLPHEPMSVRMDEQDIMPEETLEVLEDAAQDVIEGTGADNVIIVLDDIPGAPRGTQDPDIEVVEEDDDEDNKKDDDKEENKADDDLTKSVPKGRWDWQYNDADEFVHWIQNRINEVPNHSGFDTAGLERAIAYLEKVDVEISKAMRVDLDGNLDANKIEEIRAQIDNGLNKLYDRRDSIRDSKRRNKKNKKADTNLDMTKEGQKISGVNGPMVVVPLLISRLARVCINSTVSAGKDLEKVFKEQSEKYDLSIREQAELQQLLDDMGFPMHHDRGHTPDEEYSSEDTGNFDWNQNFQG